MLQILIAVVLFLISCTVVSADSQKGSAGAKSDEAAAWQTARIMPVADHRVTIGPKRIAGNFAAVLGDLKSRAEEGDAEAQYKLGLMYFRGQGAAQNYVVAYMWLDLANAGATGNLNEDTVKARFEISSLMAAEQIADARRLAIEWQKKRTPGMPTPGKEDLFNTFAKVDACSDSGHLARGAVKQTIVPRVRYYARLFFTERDIDDMGASIPIRKKKAVTAFGWGCQSAFDRLAALPLPRASSKGAR